MKEGDIVNIDVTLYYDGTQIPTFVFVVVLFTSSCCVSIGCHGDLNGTYPVGKIDEDSEQLIRTTRHALDEAIKICKPGALFRDIGKVMSVLHISGVAFSVSCKLMKIFFLSESQLLVQTGALSSARILVMASTTYFIVHRTSHTMLKIRRWAV